MRLARAPELFLFASNHPKEETSHDNIEPETIHY